MDPKYWEHFPHEADMGVRGVGNTLAEAFEQAAVALTAVITDPAKVSAVEMVEITHRGPDSELLLVDWLNALIFEMAMRKLLFSRFEVYIKDHALTARAFGEPVNKARHQPAVEIKGATYTALRVAQESNGAWIAQCVVDV